MMTDNTQYWARRVLELEVQRKSAELALSDAKSQLIACLTEDGQNSAIVDGWELKMKKIPAHFVRPESRAARILLNRELECRGLYGQVFTTFNANSFAAMASRLTEENGGSAPDWLEPFLTLREERRSIILPVNYALFTLTSQARYAVEKMSTTDSALGHGPEFSRREAFYAGEGTFFDHEVND